MLVRLSKNSFVRLYDDGEIGYITNQLTRHDRTYDSVGADFLSVLSRQPKSIDDMVSSLKNIYEVDADSLRNDLVDFILDLNDKKFVVVGNTEKELDEKDLDFSYAMGNPKTLATDFTQPTKERIRQDTETFLLEHDENKPRLASLEFEITSRCNERCIHCYIPNGKKDTGFDMSFDKFKYILDQFASMGGIHVTLSGGEALLNKDIVKMLRYCREKDLMISLLTNLTYMRDELIPILKDVNVSLVQVSLYSMNPSIHDTITTVKGSFVKTKAAIEKLHDADVPVQISCPLMKANKEGYDKVLQYAKSLRMSAQTDYIMMGESNFDTSNLANRLSLDETAKVIEDILEYDQDYQQEMEEIEPVSSIDMEEYKNMPLCGAGINDLCVTVNGDIYPCSGWQAYVVGNVYHNTLRDIWEKSPKLEAVRRVKRKDFPKCITCEAKDFCNMCLVRNYNESHGDMFKINNHFCKVAFLNKRLVEEWMKKKESKLSEVNDR